MGTTEFHLLLAANFDTYVYSLLFSFFIYYVIAKRVVFSKFDPLIFFIVSSVFSTAVVIFLYLTDMMTSYLFFSYVYSQIFFIIGLVSFPSKKRVSCGVSYEHLTQAKIILLVSLFIFLISISILFFVKGIPLFSDDTRLASFSGGSGFGLVSRVIDASVFLLLYSAILMYLHDRWKLISVISMILFVMYAVLTGSKSAILHLPFVFFFVAIIFGVSVKINIFYIAMSLVFVVVFYMLMNDVNILTAIYYFLFRLVKFGDVFYIGYVNDVIFQLEKSMNGYMSLFADFLGMTRLISWNETGEALGYRLFNYVHPNNMLLQGPNIRHNVFGLFYFGPLGGVIFSFIIGFIISLFRYLYFRKAAKTSLFLKISLAFICLNSYALPTDPVLALSKINNFIILAAIFCFSYLIFSVHRGEYRGKE